MTLVELQNADVPVGSILAHIGEDVPRGWLKCDGDAISRTTYAELFAVIGTNFGKGDGSTTFNVPDLTGDRYDYIIKTVSIPVPLDFNERKEV